MHINCANCEKPFRIKPSHAPRRVWCSVACKAEAARRRCFEEIERRYGMPVREAFNYLYNERELSIRAVAAELGTSTRTVFDWFDALGVRRRGRSEAVKLQWKDNPERRAAHGELVRVWKLNNPDAAREQSLKARIVQQHRRGPSSIERRMMDALRAAGVGFEFQFAVGGKFLCDFAFPAARLIVECDGEYWHSQPRQKQKDASKDAYLKKCGFAVLRFTGAQIETDAASCVAAIRARLTGSARI